jgi:hypothetical protein
LLFFCSFLSKFFSCFCSFDIFFSARNTQEQISKNLSSIGQKIWPIQIQDCDLKSWPKLVGPKTRCSWSNFAILNFANLAMLGWNRSKIFLRSP